MNCNSSATPVLDRFFQVRRAMNLFATQHFKSLGLGTKQAVLLRYLARRGPVSLAELARLTSGDPAATGKTVDLLVAKGWLAEQAHPTDRRRWVVRLTRRGQRLAERAERVFHRLEHAFTQPLLATERKKFLSLLERILQGLN